MSRRKNKIILPGAAGTVKRAKLSNLRMTAGNEKKFPKVILDGEVKEWVGIGWITLKEKPDPEKIPVVID